MANLPGRDLARELIDKSEAESRSTPVEAVIAAACERRFDDDKAHRLIGRLWTLERMFYYIYGGWGQGLEMNDFPPSVKYLFSKQIVDESTHEMLYLDAQLKKGLSPRRKMPSGIPAAASRSIRGWPITSSRCATWPPTRTRSASQP
jgi:hypothetical protein